jgi:hypothetical protein
MSSQRRCSGLNGAVSGMKDGAVFASGSIIS